MTQAPSNIFEIALKMFYFQMSTRQKNLMTLTLTFMLKIAFPTRFPPGASNEFQKHILFIGTFRHKFSTF